MVAFHQAVIPKEDPVVSAHHAHIRFFAVAVPARAIEHQQTVGVQHLSGPGEAGSIGYLVYNPVGDIEMLIPGKEKAVAFRR